MSGLQRGGGDGVRGTAAIIVNPSKVIDLDERRKEICDLFAEAGWSEPLWLTTTPEDPGCGMAVQALDAEMLDATPDTMKRRFGWPAYVVSGLRTLRRRRVPMRIRLDGGRWIRRRARSVLVANVGRLQGGIPLLPDAEPDDGWLDVAILTPRDITDWVRLGWGVIMRRGGTRQLETFRAKRVEVHSDREQARELDGDVVAPARMLVARISPAALLLCVPKARPGT